MTYGTDRIIVEPIPADIESRQAECDNSATRAGKAVCRFDIANEYMKAKRFERAAPLFLEVAHAEASPNARDAAGLAIESIDMLGVHANPSRHACYDVFAEEIPRLLRDLCDPLPKRGTERLCAEMHIIDVTLSGCWCPTASGGPPDAAYRAAANIYFWLATEECVLGRGKQAINDELRCDELLSYAHSWFRSSGEGDRAEQARALLLDPNHGLHDTAFAKRLVSPRGLLSHRRAWR